jgi:hypothetical protein
VHLDYKVIDIKSIREEIMGKFKIKVTAEIIVDAVDDEHAQELFFEGIESEAQQNAMSWIIDHTKVEEIKD